jgi:hypothetical protein
MTPRPEPVPERPTRRLISRCGLAFCVSLIGTVACGSDTFAPIRRDLGGTVAATPRAELSATTPATLAARPSALGQTLGQPTALRAQPSLLWRTGSALAAAPRLGPDGAIYLASSQGTLDVLEASGRHRFTITVGGAPTGAMFVDSRGRAYLGLATGKLVAVAPHGTIEFAFQTPRGVRGEVSFAEGLGLVFLGHDGVVIGINRGGFPTMRLDPHDEATAGPVGVSGWCVVGTASGAVLWGDRWGRRKHATIGSPVDGLGVTADGGIWAISDVGLVAFSPKRVEAFRRPGTAGMALSSRKLLDRGIEGVILTVGAKVEWLDFMGRSVRVASLAASDDLHIPLIMRVDDDANLWLAGANGRLQQIRPSGESIEPYEFAGESLLEPVIDAVRRRTIVATREGGIYSLAWPNPPKKEPN